MSPLSLPLALPIGLDTRLAPGLRRPLPSRTPARHRARLLCRADRHVRAILPAALHAPLRPDLLSPSHPPSLTPRRSTPPAIPILRAGRNPPGLLLASRPRQFQKSAEAAPSTPPWRAGTLLTRPAQSLSVSWAPALPVSGTSLLPSPGAAARAGYAFVLLRGSTRRHIPACSGGSGPAFKTCLQLKRAGASVSAHAFGGLTSGCSGLASLVAEP